LECGGAKFKTKVQENAGAKAEWNESFTFEVDCKDGNEELLKITVIDKDKLKDDVIGTASITLYSLAADKNDIIDLSIVDPDNFKKLSGTVFISAAWKGSPSCFGDKCHMQPKEPNVVQPDPKLEENNIYKVLSGATVVDHNGKVTPIHALKGKLVGVYFSAHWCPPCRGFTPRLAQRYQELNKSRKVFEVIFLSSDQNQSGFDEYYREMPWLALPFSDRKAKGIASSVYGVRGIPTLILFDEVGNVLSQNGRQLVMANIDSWKKN